MTSIGLSALDAEAEARWRDWRARGAQNDRRRTRTLGRLTALAALSLIVWVVLQVV